MGCENAFSELVTPSSTDVCYQVQFEREHGVSWWDLLRGRTGDAKTSTIRRLILGGGTQAMQQLAGINVTSYYLPTVLIQSVGLDEKLARLLAACNSVSYLLFSLIAIPNVERWGRRKLMMYGAAGQCVCYLIITVLLRYNEKAGYSASKEVASASIAFFFLYYVFFGIGWQGVPWLYPTEINSLSMRTKGAALGTASNWAFNCKYIPPCLDQIKANWDSSHGRRDYSYRHPISAVEILHHLDHLQRRLCANRLPVRCSSLSLLLPPYPLPFPSSYLLIKQEQKN